jgi:hypothetical protein
MSNSILNAFLQQTYGSLEKAREADKLADLNPNSKGNKHMEFEQDHKLRQEMASKLAKKPISQSMSIPSRLNAGDLNQKTESHPQFKNYDHSLEMDRKSSLRDKYLNEKYKDSLDKKPTAQDFDFNDLEVGSVEDMFNKMDEI